jgi:hypothetical protein
MKKMINRLCGAFLVVAVMVMPLCGMQPGVGNNAANNGVLLNKIVDQADKMIDVAMDTLTIVEQKQQGNASFEAAKNELVELMGKIDLAILDLNKIDLNVRKKLAQLVNRVDTKVKIKLAPLLDKIDIRTRIKLDQLMRKIDLDGEVKKAMSDAVIKDAIVVAMPLSVTDLDVAPQGKMQQAVDYISRKFQDAQQAVSAMWYGKDNKE